VVNPRILRLVCHNRLETIWTLRLV